MLGASAVSALIILGIKPCSDSIELGDAAWQARSSPTTSRAAAAPRPIEPGAPPEQLGGSPWPRAHASGRAQGRGFCTLQDQLENAIMQIWRLTSRALTVSSALVWHEPSPPVPRGGGRGESCSTCAEG